MNNAMTVSRLEVLSSWLDDNIKCENDLIFDNDIDATDSDAMYPAVERAAAVLLKIDALASNNINEIRARLKDAVECKGLISPDDVRALLRATDHLICACEDRE